MIQSTTLIEIVEETSPLLLFGGRKKAAQAVGTSGMLTGFALFMFAAVQMGLEEGLEPMWLGAIMSGAMGLVAGSSRLARFGTTDARESAEGFFVGAVLGLYLAGWVSLGVKNDAVGLGFMAVFTLLFAYVPVIAAGRCLGVKMQDDEEKKGAPKFYQ